MNLMKNARQIKKRITSSKGSGIALTNNETKDIIKVIKSLETEGILLKGTTKKIKSQGEGFLNFLWPLMSAGLLVIKNVFTPLGKSVLIPLELIKKIFGSGTSALIILTDETNDIIKIIKSLEESSLLIK